MSQDDKETQRLLDLLDQQQRKAASSDFVHVIANEVPELIAEIRDSDLATSLAGVAGLMTLPSNQARILSLEALAHLIVVFAAGSQRPTRAELNAWLNNHMARATMQALEDPVEDVAVGNVITGRGNHRILVGAWDCPDSWLQYLVDSVELMNDSAPLAKFRSELSALLALSEAVATKSGLARFQSSENASAGDLAISLDALAHRVTFSAEEIRKLRIVPGSLGAFIFDLSVRTKLSDHRTSWSPLHERPLVECGEGIVVALPAAISAALRSRLVKSLGSEDRHARFDEVVRKRQGSVLFAETLSGRLLNTDSSSELPSATPDEVSHVLVRFDEGKYAHVVLLHDRSIGILRDGLTSFMLVDQAPFLEACARQVSQRSDFRAGITLLVVGGLGRGFGLRTPTMPQNWRLTVWSLPDIAALGRVEDEWLHQIWKLHIHMEEATKLGMDFEGAPLDSNSYAYWKENGYELVPRDFAIGAAQTSVQLSSEFVASFRREDRVLTDSHAVFRPWARAWVPVRRSFPASVFRELRSLPIFASPDAAMHGSLAGVIETEKRAWWLECKPEVEDSGQRKFLFQLWEAALNWLGRLAPQLEHSLESLPDGNILIHLDLDGLESALALGDKAQILDGPATATTANRSLAVVVLAIDGPILSLLRRPQNTGERALVKAMIQGAVRLTNTEQAEGTVENLLRATISSPDARFLHSFPNPRTPRDVLAQFGPRSARVVQESDAALATIGLAWKTLAPKEEGYTLSGIEECNQFLHRSVDALWNQIGNSLDSLDRRSVVEHCLANHEGCALDRITWERTARALTNVYQDRDEVVRVAREHEEKLARSTLSSRVLAEMAVCRCPVGGGMGCGEVEFDRLLAGAAVLIRLGQDSDAVHADLGDPIIRIFPNGDFVVYEEFYKEVIEGYRAGYFSELFDDRVRAYDDLYEEPKRVGVPVEQVFEAEFISAFGRELGIPLQDLVRVDEALHEYAVDRESLVVGVLSKELQELLAERVGWDRALFERFCQRFCLWPRERWERAPVGFTNADWHPWRFRRRLSLMARPLVSLGEPQDDNVFIYAPGLLHDAFGRVVINAYRGKVDAGSFTTAEMRSWIGAVNDRRGHSFNQRVATELSDRGFRSRASVSMSEFRVPTELGDLGDIDALAWTSSGIVYLIECKNLRFAGAMGEIVDQLKRFRGEAGDELQRHMKRCAWLQRNPDSVKAVIGVPVISRFVPLVVTNTVVPMRYATGLPLPAENILHLREFLERIRLGSM